jgi:hypothetical protein
MLYDLREENYARRAEVLFEAMDKSPPEKLRPHDVPILIKTLKLTKACGTDGVPNENLRHFPRGPHVYLTYLFNH